MNIRRIQFVAIACLLFSRAIPSHAKPDYSTIQVGELELPITFRVDPVEADIECAILLDIYNRLQRDAWSKEDFVLRVKRYRPNIRLHLLACVILSSSEVADFLVSFRVADHREGSTFPIRQ
jgi:hypothetical protein